MCAFYWSQIALSEEDIKVMNAILYGGEMKRISPFFVFESHKLVQIPAFYAAFKACVQRDELDVSLPPDRQQAVLLMKKLWNQWRAEVLPIQLHVAIAFRTALSSRPVRVNCFLTWTGTTNAGTARYATAALKLARECRHLTPFQWSVFFVNYAHMGRAVLKTKRGGTLSMRLLRRWAKAKNGRAQLEYQERFLPRVRCIEALRAFCLGKMKDKQVCISGRTGKRKRYPEFPYTMPALLTAFNKETQNEHSAVVSEFPTGLVYALMWSLLTNEAYVTKGNVPPTQRTVQFRDRPKLAKTSPTDILPLPPIGPQPKPVYEYHPFLLNPFDENDECSIKTRKRDERRARLYDQEVRRVEREKRKSRLRRLAAEKAKAQ